MAVILIFPLLGIFSIITKYTSLKKYSLPVSFLASIVVLSLLTLFPEYRKNQIVVDWQDMPSVLIALVFAGLFMEKKETDNLILDYKEVLLQGLFVWMAILGQTIIALFLVLVLLVPLFGTPPVFAMLVETGFAGGHGTAAAMGDVFKQNGLNHGLALGQFSATIGLIFGTFVGLGLLAKDGYLIKHTQTASVPKVKTDILTIINQLLVSLSLIAVIYFAGLFVHDISKETKMLPLFVYTLLASVALKYLLHLFHFEKIIFTKMVEIISLVFSEMLIFTGIATINLSVIKENLPELSILFISALVWNIFVFKKLLPFFIKQVYSYELGAINFGMLNGTTATGIMLLKVIDPEVKGNALKIYGKAAPMTSPFIGGGMLTLALPFFLTHYNSWIVLLLLISLWGIAFMVSWLLKTAKL